VSHFVQPANATEVTRNTTWWFLFRHTDYPCCQSRRVYCHCLGSIRCWTTLFSPVVFLEETLKNVFFITSGIKIQGASKWKEN